VQADEMRIGQLAKRMGVNPRTIRFYEQAGVLPEPERTAGGYRVYTAEDEARLRFIKAAQRLGLRLGEIREVLALRDRGQRPCPYVAELIDARLAEVDARMRELRTLEQELRTLRSRIAEEGMAAEARFCHFIESSAGDEPPGAPPSPGDP
jgi:MerR family copper efflux transcriptional regulator